jgi:hypothetical protein
MRHVCLGLTSFSFCCVLSAQENPIFSISTGYIHLNAYQDGSGRANFDGWYAIPQYHITKSWSAIPDTFGPLYAFDTKTRVTPFVFGEIGDVRTSAPGDIANAFSFAGGVGGNIKLVNHVSPQIIPGDYILTTPPERSLHHWAGQAGPGFDFASK